MTHPFATYIQALGKGRRGARDLTFAEAEQAMQMILSGQVEAEQLGAFLMLMRVKEETPDELAGFVQAARNSVAAPADFPEVALDWAAYAGKRRQLPWYVLSALLLAQHDIKVLMHGTHMPGRVCVDEVLASFGIAAYTSYAQAAQHIQKRNFAYLSLPVLSPKLQHLLDLKATLGLRSPVHSIVRMLNPARATSSMIGIFHPGYDQTHQAAAVLLGDKNLAVFKGEGGDAERNPDSACEVRMVLQEVACEETWPALFAHRHLKDEAMDVTRLGKLWRAEIEDEYAQAATISTAAIALRTLGHAQNIEQAMQQAGDLWQQRDQRFLPG